jgi:hypothetical protein
MAKNYVAFIGKGKKIVPAHPMKAYRANTAQLHAFLNSAPI